jgi:RNA polymerase sigma-70 factor, ECF subfamily
MNHNVPKTGSFASAFPSSTSSTLLQRVKSHDTEAWRRLVRLHGPLVFLWSCRSGLAREDAADVAQEVWAAVAKHVAEFRRDRPGDTFRGRLWTITRNKARDRLRGQEPSAVGGTSVQRAMAEIPDDQTDSSQLVPNERQILMRRALELIQPEFEDRTWKAFWRAAVDQRPAAEVAAELAITPGAVRQAKYRILRRLREEMDGLLE